MTTKWRRFPISRYPGDVWGDWNRLNDDYHASHPMMDSRFVARLIEFFPAEVSVVVAYNNNQEVIAMLLTQSDRFFVNELYRPSQAQLALAMIPTSTPISFAGLLGCMPWNMLRLDMYSLDPLYHSALTSQRNSDLERGALNMAIDVGKDFSEYWSQRPKNLRKNVSRYINRINRDFGSIRLDVVTEKFAMQDAVSRYGVIESSGWKGNKGTALHPDNVQGEFYCEVMQDFAADGKAFVFELFLSEKLVASRLCVSSEELLIILKTTYDENYSNYATGRILLYETVKYIFDHQISSRIDFYTNATQDQLAWASDSRVMYNLSLYRGVLKQLIKPLHKMIKRW